MYMKETDPVLLIRAYETRIGYLTNCLREFDVYSNLFDELMCHIDLMQSERARLKGILFRSFCPDEAGLSLGNEVSQIPASWFPSEIDHFFKDCLGMPIFRYMDDSLLICKQGEEEKIIQIFQRKSEKLHLSCPDEKIHVYHSKESFAFCKEQFVWDGAGGHYDHLMNQQISQHEMRKILHFEQADDVPKERAERQIRGVLGSIASHPHSYSAIKKLRSEIRP